MQFGKKTRNLAAASRRFFGERPPQGGHDPGPAVGTLEHSYEEENTMTPPPQEESMVAGDPTQRLLTALGRFQRQVSRAEEGAPQEAWCDECISQLITGIEIALNEDWDDVKEALTDVARILQTYEDVGRADQSVYFLKDSYEILCLMVGDLIVGNVRSGVMKKWQERYERALDELADAGLTLVDDDGPADRDVPHGRETTDASTAETIDTTDEQDFDSMLEESTAGDLPDSVFDKSIEAMSTGRTFGTDPGDPFAPLDLDAGAASPFGLPDQNEAIAQNAASLPSLDELLGRPITDTDDLEDEAGNTALELSDDFTADNEDAIESEENTAPTYEAPEHETVDTEAEPPANEVEELDFDGKSATPEPELELELKPEPEPEPVVAPAPAGKPEPKPEPQEVEPEPGSSEALFRNSQRAMAMGNIADAKLFALQLAANMAKLEADQAAGRIAIIEADIAQNAQSIATGEASVHEAEHRVKQLEEQVSQCQRDFEAKREQITKLQEEAAAVEASVQELNRQIAELEARRDAESERLATCQMNLDDNISEENRMQSELEALGEEEVGSRENLDGARDHVLVLQQTGEAHAAALRAAQEELDSRRAAVNDIENTIRQVGGVLSAAAESPATSAEADHGEKPAENDPPAAE